MKKVLLLVATVLFAASAFAQDISVGARVGSSFQAVGQYKYNGVNYVEARFGTSVNNPAYVVGLGANDIIDVVRESNHFMCDLTLLHNWHVFDMDWTPSLGEWFFDAGAGLNFGGIAGHAYVGVSGMARLGFAFLDWPITLSVDWTPSFGPAVRYGKYTNEYGVDIKVRHTSFNTLGLATLGITCTYNF